MATRRRAAENKQVIQPAGRIDRRELGGIDRFQIVIIHLLEFACAPIVGCGQISNREDRPNVAGDNAKSLARVAREKSRAEKRDLAGLRDEEKWEGTSSLQRRSRRSTLFRLDRRNHEIDRRKLFRAAVQPAPEREEPALGDEQGAR